ncbi:hypothetical protein FNV43_RR22347 [Rhamnella rubrinervis]|uniref:Uncharacterized protein n=1 Tax=Rhamnella rubrinervis TaxID=2594499 RepID=A0A8K0DQB3_9ROSA|nr:hypothetical protein FNV43_RR22347 [Rhamnella rubrinervis]
MKGKFMPFYSRAAKPSSTVQYMSTTKVVKPSQSSPSTASVGFVHVQDYVISGQPKQKVSFILPENTRESAAAAAAFGKFDSSHGAAIDDAVDMKAAIYISSVQERFKLERVNSERIKCQEIH